MDATYQITGMHCSACVEKIQAAMSSVDGVTHSEVTLNPPMATVHTAHPVPFENLSNAVASAGRYTLEPNESALIGETTIETNHGFFGVYYPLVLIVSFIIGGVVVREITRGEWQMDAVMTNFMGGFFVAFAFFKLLDLRGFAESFQQYDLVAKQSYGYGISYPFIELGLGLAYFLGFAPTVTNTVTLALMIVGSAGVWKALQRTQTIQCACLGTVFELPMSTVTLVENGVMGVMAAAMLIT